ncbi:MAG: AMP-binding protein, partial [Prevotellaceae bacterium]|nr:AMP-binding protein [Prevotellaceae bacterium]
MKVTLPSRDGETLVKPHNRVAIISPDRKISFTGLLRYASLFASHTPGKGTKTLIVSENREGWIYAIYGIWKNEGVLVPVDAASTADDIAYIINDCEPAAVWTSETKLPLVEEAIEKSGKKLDIMMIDDYERADISEQEVAEIPLRLEDTACICYTSGTTGSPKGVMLSFTNIMENVKAISVEVPIFDEERRTLILLPLHHVLPLVGTAVMPLVIGGGVAICPSLSGPDIMATLKRGEIGIMIGVPRLWQTLFRGIKAKIDANPVTRKLYEMCEKAQNRTLSRTVFKSVRDKMGGHITYLVSGGAALDHDTAIGLKTLGLDLLEGYGMTEASPMIAFTRPGDIVPGSVGLA